MRNRLALAALLLLLPLVQDPQRTAPGAPTAPAMQDPAPQDPPLLGPPVPALPPADARPLPPVPDLPLSAVDRRDLIQRFLPPTPVEGFWELRRMVVRGHDVEPVRGYAWFGQRHMTLDIVQGSPTGGEPLVQAGVRRYRLDGELLSTTALIGHDNHAGDELRFDAPGLVEQRRAVVAGPALRIERDEQTWLEFFRIE
ncbi:MAG: hypothetical protein IPM29_32445 [Planctomycetes bacterium]|nr:hypothetical protein [Planctomycetota bacterium]